MKTPFPYQRVCYKHRLLIRDIGPILHLGTAQQSTVAVVLPKLLPECVSSSTRVLNVSANKNMDMNIRLPLGYEHDMFHELKKIPVLSELLRIIHAHTSEHLINNIKLGVPRKPMKIRVFRKKVQESSRF